MARKTVTITEYAKSLKLQRDTIYKRIDEGRLGDAGDGARLIKVAGRNFISLPEKKISEKA